jgi:hypothetical protein
MSVDPGPGAPPVMSVNTQPGAPSAVPASGGSRTAGSPVPSWAQVRAWRAAPFETAAQDLGVTGNRMVSAVEDFAAATPKGWSGLAAEGALRTRRELTSQLEGQVEEMAAVRSVLFRAADAVTEIERAVGDIELYASAKILSISPDGVVTDVLSSRHILGPPTPDYLAERQQAVQTCADQLGQVLRQAGEVAATVAAALAGIAAGRAVAWGSGGRSLAGGGSPGTQAGWDQAIAEFNDTYLGPPTSIMSAVSAGPEARALLGLVQTRRQVARDLADLRDTMITAKDDLFDQLGAGKITPGQLDQELAGMVGTTDALVTRLSPFLGWGDEHPTAAKCDWLTAKRGARPR